MYITKKKNSIVVLSDGLIFYGLSILKQSNLLIELVFNTANSGYQETITDPSYCNQGLIFTTPHIGNTGINYQDNESNRVWISCLIVRQLIDYRDIHLRQKCNISQFLYREGVVIINCSETRGLVSALKNQINPFAFVLHRRIKKIKMMIKNVKYIRYVSSKNFVSNDWMYSNNSFASKRFMKSFIDKIVVVNLGVKKSVLCELSERKHFLIIVNHRICNDWLRRTSAAGVVVSNGPGDPGILNKLIVHIRRWMKIDIKILGICLGHQLICRALNIGVVKMMVGHHGINHPIYCASDRYAISSQNHQYCCADTKSFIRSLFDKTNQGIYQKNLLTIQGHPEASPGTNDLKFIFDYFA
ncbi:carbamoyl phosphate synthase small subunit [Candidatus Vidania fulgoroideorum]